MSSTIPFPARKPESATPAVEAGGTIAETLARFANAITYDDIPAQVRQRAKELMLDSVGIALASTRYDFAHRTLNASRSLGGPGDHAVIGMATRLPLRDAALVNGVLIHGLDYDDTHIQAATHITCSLLPTAIGVAAQEGLTGKDLLAAYVAGHEVIGRIGSVTEGQWHIVGFHPTGILGAFGCAITAGKLFGASDEQLAMAQGIALSMGSGSLEFLEDGAWTKRMHPGWAAVSGITAAAMAKHGFIGPKKAYEGRFGLWKGHLGPLADEVHMERATEGMFERWEVMRSAVKPFPACHFNHATADATLTLVAQHGLKADQIKRVLARMPAPTVKVVCEPLEAKRVPQGAYEAQFSIPYIVAASVVRGRFGLAELEPEVTGDREILDLAAKVDYEIDPDSHFPDYYSGDVTIETVDGRTLRHREPKNRGAGDRPLSTDDIVAKYMDNATLAVSRERAERIRDLVLSLDGLGEALDLEEGIAG